MSILINRFTTCKRIIRIYSVRVMSRGGLINNYNYKIIVDTIIMCVLISEYPNVNFHWMNFLNNKLYVNLCICMRFICHNKIAEIFIVVLNLFVVLNETIFIAQKLSYDNGFLFHYITYKPCTVLNL